MPRILTPNNSFQRRGSNNSFQRRGSNTFRVSYRPNPSIPAVTKQRRNSDGDSYRSHVEKTSCHSWQHQDNTPHSDDSGPSSIVTASTVGSPESTPPTQFSPNSRFRIVSRQKSLRDAHQVYRNSFLPNAHVKEEDVWGQFVDVTEEEEKIVRNSKILSRA